MDKPPVSDDQVLEEAKAIARRLAESLPSRIEIGALTPNSKLPFKALAIRELLV